MVCSNEFTVVCFMVLFFFNRILVFFLIGRYHARAILRVYFTLLSTNFTSGSAEWRYYLRTGRILEDVYVLEERIQKPATAD